jgi:hypothetical protein
VSTFKNVKNVLLKNDVKKKVVFYLKKNFLTIQTIATNKQMNHHEEELFDENLDSPEPSESGETEINEQIDDEGIEELVLRENELPAFCIVEMSQVLRLLQVCPNCRRLPRERVNPDTNTLKIKNVSDHQSQRKFKFTQTGTNITVTLRCACKDKVKWSAQSCVPGTNMRRGNIRLASAATVAPVTQTRLDKLFRAANIACFGKHTRDRIAHDYSWPEVKLKHYEEQVKIMGDLPDEIEICADAQYDSPGFCAEHCIETAIEIKSKKVLVSSCLHKSETRGMSNQMEIEGFTRVVDEIEDRWGKKIVSVTVDKHKQVLKHLRQKHIQARLDLWHRLRSFIKEVYASVRALKKGEEDVKRQLIELGKRFTIHIHMAVRIASGKVDQAQMCREQVYAFFFHVLGVHEWMDERFVDQVNVSEGTKIGTEAAKLEFRIIYSCNHVDIDEYAEPRYADVDPDSKAYQILLAIATKNNFFDDLELLSANTATSLCESFHNKTLFYKEKRVAYRLPGLKLRNMLATLDWNNLQEEESQGRRPVVEVFQCHSKAKRGLRWKERKGKCDDSWKREIVDRAEKRKERFGPGRPTEDYEDDEETDEEIVEGERINVENLVRRVELMFMEEGEEGELE